MFQWCFNEVSIVFWVCFRVFQGSFNGVSEKFQGWFKDVSGVFQRFLKKIFKVFKKVSCSMALIAAFWAEGGLVFLTRPPYISSVALPVQLVFSSCKYVYLRGAIIKKTEQFGKNSLMGGRGVNFFSKKSQFQFGNFEHPGEGSQFFKNVLILIIW